jgi:uncharacterized membrane protein YebE (DUF533 family)
LTREQISGYVDEEEKQTFKAHAEAADMSLSEWVVQACREKVQEDGLVDEAQRYEIEDRLLKLVDEAADRAADQIVDEVLDDLASEGVLDEDSIRQSQGDQYEWGDNP